MKCGFFTYLQHQMTQQSGSRNECQRRTSLHVQMYLLSGISTMHCIQIMFILLQSRSVYGMKVKSSISSRFTQMESTAAHFIVAGGCGEFLTLRPLQ